MSEPLSAALIHVTTRRHDHTDECDGCRNVEAQLRNALAASERPPVDPQAWFRLGSFVHSLTPTKTLTQEQATELYDGLVTALSAAAPRPEGPLDAEDYDIGDNGAIIPVAAVPPEGLDVERLRGALEDMVNQFAYWGGDGITTGGLSALEEAFDVLGYSDPQPAPWRGCDEPGCKQEGTSGWPSPTGYRRTCHEHSDFHVQRRCNYPPDDPHFAHLSDTGEGEK